MAATVQVAPAPYVTLEVAESITGYSVRAIEGKIARGDWVEGREYRRALRLLPGFLPSD